MDQHKDQLTCYFVQIGNRAILGSDSFDNLAQELIEQIKRVCGGVNVLGQPVKLSHSVQVTAQALVFFTQSSTFFL
jgi:hypothetical protein